MTTMRIADFSGAAICMAALGVAYFFMEKYLGLPPCPLCILDRIAVGLMAIIFLIGGIFSPSGKMRAIFLSLQTAFSGGGFLFAGRHIILQNRPLDDSANCLADAEAAQHFMELIQRAFSADGDCGLIYWQFAGLSIPEQTLILFFVLAIFIAAQWILFFRK